MIDVGSLRYTTEVDLSGALRGFRSVERQHAESIRAASRQAAVAARNATRERISQQQNANRRQLAELRTRSQREIALIKTSSRERIQAARLAQRAEADAYRRTERAARESYRSQERAARRSLAEQQRIVSNSTRRMQASFQALRNTLSGLLGAGAIGAGLGAAVFRIGSGFAQTRIQIEGLIGDVGRAREIIGELRNFAARTPITFPQVANATQQLAAAQLSADRLVSTVRDLTAATKAEGEALQRASRTIAQVLGKQVADAVDIKELINANVFEIRGAIAQALGITAAEVADAVKDRRVTADVLLEAIGIVGGRSQRVVEQRSREFAGRLSTSLDGVRESVISLYRELDRRGTLNAVIDIVDGAAVVVGSLARNLDTVLPLIKNTVLAVLSFRAARATLSIWESLNARIAASAVETKNAATAQQQINRAQQGFATSTAVATAASESLAAATQKVSNAAGNLERNTGNVQGRIRDLASRTDAFSTAVSNNREQVRAFNESVLAARTDGVNKLNESFTDLRQNTKGLDGELPTRLENVAKAYRSFQGVSLPAATTNGITNLTTALGTLKQAAIPTESQTKKIKAAGMALRSFKNIDPSAAPTVRSLASAIGALSKKTLPDTLDRTVTATSLLCETLAGCLDNWTKFGAGIDNTIAKLDALIPKLRAAAQASAGFKPPDIATNAARDIVRQTQQFRPGDITSIARISAPLMQAGAEPNDEVMRRVAELEARERSLQDKGLKELKKIALEELGLSKDQVRQFGALTKKLTFTDAITQEFRRQAQLSAPQTRNDAAIDVLSNRIRETTARLKQLPINQQRPVVAKLPTSTSTALLKLAPTQAEIAMGMERLRQQAERHYRERRQREVALRSRQLPNVLPSSGQTFIGQPPAGSLPVLPALPSPSADPRAAQLAAANVALFLRAAMQSVNTIETTAVQVERATPSPAAVNSAGQNARIFLKAFFTVSKAIAAEAVEQAPVAASALARATVAMKPVATFLKAFLGATGTLAVESGRGVRELLDAQLENQRLSATRQAERDRLLEAARKQRRQILAAPNDPDLARAKQGQLRAIASDEFVNQPLRRLGGRASFSLPIQRAAFEANQLLAAVREISLEWSHFGGVIDESAAKARMLRQNLPDLGSFNRLQTQRFQQQRALPATRRQALLPGAIDTVESFASQAASRARSELRAIGVLNEGMQTYRLQLGAVDAAMRNHIADLQQAQRNVIDLTAASFDRLAAQTDAGFAFQEIQAASLQLQRDRNMAAKQLIGLISAAVSEANVLNAAEARRNAIIAQRRALMQKTLADFGRGLKRLTSAARVSVDQTAKQIGILTRAARTQAEFNLAQRTRTQPQRPFLRTVQPLALPPGRASTPTADQFNQRQNIRNFRPAPIQSIAVRQVQALPPGVAQSYERLGNAARQAAADISLATQAAKAQAAAAASMGGALANAQPQIAAFGRATKAAGSGLRPKILKDQTILTLGLGRAFKVSAGQVKRFGTNASFTARAINFTARGAKGAAIAIKGLGATILTSLGFMVAFTLAIEAATRAWAAYRKNANDAAEAERIRQQIFEEDSQQQREEENPERVDLVEALDRRVANETQQAKALEQVRNLEAEIARLEDVQARAANRSKDRLDATLAGLRQELSLQKQIADQAQKNIRDINQPVIDRAMAIEDLRRQGVDADEARARVDGTGETQIQSGEVSVTIEGDAISQALQRAIIGQESGGDFQAVNPVSGALGFGQLMPSNVAPWTLEALGRSLTQDEFLNDPNAQIETIRFQLKKIFDEQMAVVGDIDLAVRRTAAVWYGGPRNANSIEDTATQFYDGVPFPSFQEYTNSVLRRFQSEIDNPTQIDAVSLVNDRRRRQQENARREAERREAESRREAQRIADEAERQAERDRETLVRTKELISQGKLQEAIDLARQNDNRLSEINATFELQRQQIVDERARSLEDTQDPQTRAAIDDLAVQQLNAADRQRTEAIAAFQAENQQRQLAINLDTEILRAEDTIAQARTDGFEGLAMALEAQTQIARINADYRRRIAEAATLEQGIGLEIQRRAETQGILNQLGRDRVNQLKEQKQAQQSLRDELQQRRDRFELENLELPRSLAGRVTVEQFRQHNSAIAGINSEFAQLAQQARDTFSPGQQEALRAYLQELEGLKNIEVDNAVSQFRRLSDTGLQVRELIVGELSTSFSDMFQGLIRGTESVGDAFIALKDRLLDGFLQILDQQMFQPLLQGVFGSLFGLGNQGDSFTSAPFRFPQSANFQQQQGGSGLLQGALSILPSFLPFAEGGVVTRPTLALIGEAGREAVLPLDSPQAIQMMGGDGMGGTNVNAPVAVNVTVNSDGSSNITTSGNAKQLGKQLGVVVRSVLLEESIKPNGLLRGKR